MWGEGKRNDRGIQSGKGGTLIGKADHQINGSSIAILGIGSFDLKLIFHWVELEICQDNRTDVDRE